MVAVAVTALAVCTVLPSKSLAAVTVTVTQTSIGTSKFRAGATHTQDSLDPGHNETALAAAKPLLQASCAYQNQHIMGWGVCNPWPLSTGAKDWTKAPNV